MEKICTPFSHNALLSKRKDICAQASTVRRPSLAVWPPLTPAEPLAGAAISRPPPTARPVALRLSHVRLQLSLAPSRSLERRGESERTNPPLPSRMPQPTSFLASVMESGEHSIKPWILSRRETEVTEQAGPRPTRDVPGCRESKSLWKACFPNSFKTDFNDRLHITKHQEYFYYLKDKVTLICFFAGPRH